MKKVKIFRKEFVIMNASEMKGLMNDLGTVEWNTTLAEYQLEEAMKTKNGETRRGFMESMVRELRHANEELKAVLKSLSK